MDGFQKFALLWAAMWLLFIIALAAIDPSLLEW